MCARACQCVCVYVCACARVRVCVCVCVRATHTRGHVCIPFAVLRVIQNRSFDCYAMAYVSPLHDVEDDDDNGDYDDD